MDREAFARQMRRLLAAYNREMKGPSLDVWFEAMKDFEGSDLAFQVDRSIAACKMPVLGEMLAGLKERAQERLGRAVRASTKPGPDWSPPAATAFGVEAAGIVAELTGLLARKMDINPARRISDEEAKVATAVAKAQLIEAAVRHGVDTSEWAYAPAADSAKSLETHKAYQAVKAWYDSSGVTRHPSFSEVCLLNPDWIKKMNRLHDGLELYLGEGETDGVPHEQGDPGRQGGERPGPEGGRPEQGGELFPGDLEEPPW